MATTTNGDVTIHYSVHGEGRPLLMLHGYTATAEDWRNQRDAWPGWRLITPDGRGHGQTTVVPRDRYSLPELASDALAVLDAEGVDQAVILGHSLGGMVLSELVTRHPARVTAAIFSATTPLPPDPTRRATLQEQLAGMRALPAGSTEVSLMGRTIALESGIGCAAVQEEMTSFADALRGLPIPALVVWGSADSSNIQSGSAALLELLPNAQPAQVPETGHVLYLTHPDAYNQAVGAFLASLPA